MKRIKLLPLLTALLCATTTWATVVVNGQLPGAFSVSSTKQVWFSQGNLQHSGANTTGAVCRSYHKDLDAMVRTLP